MERLQDAKTSIAKTTDQKWEDLALIVYEADQRFREGYRLTPKHLEKLVAGCLSLANGKPLIGGQFHGA